MAENKRRLLLSTSCNAYLHEDLRIEIMSRVPAKSLTRFKGVSKQWKSIIEDPTFITLHHKRAHSRSDGGSLLISTPLMPKRDYHELRLFSVPYNGGPARPLLPNLLSKLKEYKASPSTHGLILLSPKNLNPNRPVFVFNPTTQKLVPIPPLQICTDANDDDDDYEELCMLTELDPDISLMSTHSLGYDPSTGVYKILSIYIAARNRLEKIGCNLYHVFTLGSSKDWRKLDSTAYELISEDTLVYHSTCANGTIYFKTNHNSISAFDVREEKFFLVTPPPQVTPKYKVMALGGRLALRENRHFVWILEDDKWICMELEMPFKWRNYAIVGDYTIAGGIQSSDKYLLADQFQVCNELLCVYYCDKNGEDWSKFQITGLPRLKLRAYGFLTSTHVETLFSPNASLQR